MGKNKNIVSVFFTSFIRIRGVFNWSAFSFIGFILGMSSLKSSEYLIPLLFFVASIFCITSFTFAINNFYDIESDRKNPKKIRFNAMASGRISKQTGVFLNIIFVVVPLVVSFLFKLEIFFFCVLLIFWMWIYSSPPLRLKGRPGIDIMWHFFAFFLLIMWGSLIAGSITLINWLVAISVGMFSCIAQIMNHMGDYEFDKESGTKTYVVSKGLEKARLLLKITGVLHMILLVPLVVLYSLSYVYTIFLLFLGIVLGVYVIKSKKGSPNFSIYYFLFVFGFAVYGSCIIYHISFLLGIPTIGLLTIITPFG
ncbi:MAG: UbiA prenyltransferase family protein [Euryarchaeota archaeon]|nr:UbiA prenyltransferase family protein [Euryarchaeota archaeon]